MGEFFAVSAFRSAAPEALAAATVAYAQKHSARAEVLAEPLPVDDAFDALFFAPRNGWAVALWPSHFSIHDVRLCADVTRALDLVAVTVNVFEGAFWTMEALRSGALVDAFSPRGDYFSEDEESAAAARRQWQGNPEAVAALLDCSPEVLRPYYRYVGEQDEEKASADDESPLRDFWVFTDLWRRLGIEFPSDPAAFAARVRFGRWFAKRLPTWEGEPLE